tara:strand:+ start:136 stop:345 length:210 start_codon:yes stop_codon:yes gene_type:complete
MKRKNPVNILFKKFWDKIKKDHPKEYKLYKESMAQSNKEFFETLKKRKMKNAMKVLFSKGGKNGSIYKM